MNPSAIVTRARAEGGLPLVKGEARDRSRRIGESSWFPLIAASLNLKAMQDHSPGPEIRFSDVGLEHTGGRKVMQTLNQKQEHSLDAATNGVPGP